MHSSAQVHKQKEQKEHSHTKRLQPTNTTRRNTGIGAYKHTATHPQKHTTMYASRQELSQHTDTQLSEAQAYKHTDAQTAQLVCRNTAKVADGYKHTGIGYKHARKQARRHTQQHEQRWHKHTGVQIYEHSSTHAYRKLQ